MKKRKKFEEDFDFDLEEEELEDDEELEEYERIRAEQERLFWKATAFDKGETLLGMLFGKKF
jgi:hypothetical protein